MNKQLIFDWILALYMLKLFMWLAYHTVWSVLMHNLRLRRHVESGIDEPDKAT